MTPSKAKAMGFEEARTICQDYTTSALKAISETRRAKPNKFRFLYISGSSAERDKTKKPWVLGDLCLMRVSNLTRVI